MNCVACSGRNRTTHLTQGMERSRKMTATEAPRKKPATTSEGWCLLSTIRDAATAQAKPSCRGIHSGQAEPNSSAKVDHPPLTAGVSLEKTVP